MIFEKSSVDKEKSPTSDYGNRINKGTELFIIIIISVNAFNVPKAAQLINSLADSSGSFQPTERSDGFLIDLDIFPALINRAAAQTVNGCQDHQLRCVQRSLKYIVWKFE